MKSPYVNELEANKIVTTSFLVHSKEVRQKKSGELYLSLLLGDRTGELDAKMWDNVAEVIDSFERDDFVKVKGLIQVFHNRPQLTIHKMRRMDDSEIQFGDYFPSSRRDAEEMWKELRAIVAGLGNRHLKGLVEALLDDEDIGRRYRLAPAAKQIHHAFLGGLIEHVLSLCALARMTAPHYRNIDVDLLLAGVVLHDIGKIYELNYERGFSYSSEGQLLGHINIGLRMVGDKLRALPDFPPALRSLVEHMILSHHGQLEFGSPKLPQFPEALLLHYLDDMDSKMECMRALIENDRQVEGYFTTYHAALERPALKKERFLNGHGEPPRARAEGEPSAPAPPEGTTGTPGTAGNSDAAGTPGTAGNSGTSGPAGSPGNPAAAGTPGTAGSSESFEAAWAPGSSGTAGSSGRPGTLGIAGSSGRPRTPGTAGSSGSSESFEAAGSPGSSGTAGSSGRPRTPGTAGSSDATAAPGTSGIAGGSGSSGTAGSSGRPGTPGTSGRSDTAGAPTSGIAGGSGTSGTAGTSGRSDAAGAPGAPGTSGIAGGSGSSGTAGGSGSSGTAGSSGRPGTPGTAGSSGRSDAATAPGTSGAAESSGTGRIPGIPGSTGAWKTSDETPGAPAASESAAPASKTAHPLFAAKPDSHFADKLKQALQAPIPKQES